MDRVVDHILHITEVAGAGHVGLGSDLIQVVNADITSTCCEDRHDFDWVLPGLASHGWRDAASMAARGPPDQAQSAARCAGISTRQRPARRRARRP
ncbi:dipeptidase [Streptomyces sp. NBC_00133]|uniref:membrane dipeptidase n=1 Tax=Streptomyces sp. NBC_00133 TaxID=2903624 RepID=UPI0032501FEF